ncbi:putative bifunctional diguanylate cyclase/phosphodiesterase [Paenibacillus sp. GXUN7292]|uniref:putative bifunctional diguanylate cyclase/phosphodiesterase n=1 Tax=Paenibacillus sp. GXUN7292 TaxID=3422499 RepID=UPI003D7CBB29
MHSIHTSTKRMRSVLLIISCFLLALGSHSFEVPTVYGIPFALTSLFLLYSLYYQRLSWSIVGAAFIYSIGVFIWDYPIATFIGLIEIVFVGTLMRTTRMRLLKSDVIFWLLLGAPIAVLIHNYNYTYKLTDAVMIACILAMNGLFNSLFAEILYQYMPFSQIKKHNSRLIRPYTMNQMLLHLAMALVMITSLFNTISSSNYSFKETTRYVKQLSASYSENITRAWNDLLAINRGWTETETMKVLQERLLSVPDHLIIHIANQQREIVASNKPSLIGGHLSDYIQPRSAISGQLQFITPKHESYSWQHGSWQTSFYTLTLPLPDSDWNVHMIHPMQYYQESLFSKYYVHLLYMLTFAFLAAIVAHRISGRISRRLTQLAIATRNLPLKLKQLKPMEWHHTNLVEIHSLTNNFKHMSDSLLHIFNETQIKNEQLQAQAYMLQQSEEKLHSLAFYDRLTGLPNRLELARSFEALSSIRNLSDGAIAILSVDINQFKRINDTLGYSVGDSLLQQAALRLSAQNKACGTVFRAGEDGFLFLYPYAKENDLHACAQKIIDGFNEPFVIDNVPLFMTVSVGISLYPYDSNELDKLVRNADMAMYKAKEEGDGCYRLFQPNLVSVMTEKMLLENGLYHALHHQQFSLHYQPKVDAVSEEICGIEALIRWRHPELGMIPPDKFIPLAELSGFILEIDRWVFHEACRQNKAWQDAGLRKISVSVNISARHFNQGDIVGMITGALEDTGLEPQYVSIEITEGVFMQNMEQVIEKIGYLRKLGIHISIDDFGTGYSSLNQLQRLPISDVKLDRSFIQGITQDPKKSSLVKAIIDLVHSMNMKVIAEGVETEDESSFCSELECDELQGYYFSRPLSADQFIKYLQAETF